MTGKGLRNPNISVPFVGRADPRNIDPSFLLVVVVSPSSLSSSCQPGSAASAVSLPSLHNYRAPDCKLIRIRQNCL